MSSRWHDLRSRLITALSGWTLVLSALFLAPPWVFAALVLLFIAAATWEFVALVSSRRPNTLLASGTAPAEPSAPADVPETPASTTEGATAADEDLATTPTRTRVAHVSIVVATLAVSILTYVKSRPPQTPADIAPAAALYLVTWIVLLRHIRFPTPDRIGSIALIAVMYCGILPIHMALLRDRGLFWVLLAIIITWGGSITGYLVGKTPGAHTIAPRISPNKTYEGAMVILLASVALACLFNALNDARLPYGPLIFVAAVASVLSQAGDFLESALKRRAGVKDSANWLPAQGGVLDMIDGAIWVAPWIYYAGALIE